MAMTMAMRDDDDGDGRRHDHEEMGDEARRSAPWLRLSLQSARAMVRCGDRPYYRARGQPWTYVSDTSGCTPMALTKYHARNARLWIWLVAVVFL